jgi:phosphate transport system substrate-binding protein
VKLWTMLSLAAALAALPAQAGAQEVVGSADITGAGSTFAYPIIAKWAKGYQHFMAGGGDFPVAGAGLDDPPAGPILDYEPVGSLAGTMRIQTGAINFGASDRPLPSAELRKLGLAQFPLVIGGAVAVVNLDGVEPGQMRFTGSLLADIFLGKVQNWSDPAIAVLNPGLKLPDAKIVVVHRSDGSGTTFNFANYLSKVSSEWREKVGFDLIVPWPTGIGAKGNKGVAETVAKTANSIGYVEYVQAIRSGLSFASIQNQAGTFVKPESSSFQAAAASANWRPDEDFNLMLTDAPGEDAYPIVATVFVLMRKEAPAARTRHVLNFLKWSFDQGARNATGLGYVPLPQALVAQIREYWAKTLQSGLQQAGASN